MSVVARVWRVRTEIEERETIEELANVGGVGLLESQKLIFPEAAMEGSVYWAQAELDCPN
jgi:hypothetical protein